jgi:hypothetical protein
MQAEALSHVGVGVAGDAFDFRIVDNLVSPRLGKGASYRSFGKLLPLPSHYHAALAQWHRLSLLKDARTLAEFGGGKPCQTFCNRNSGVDYAPRSEPARPTLLLHKRVSR